MSGHTATPDLLPCPFCGGRAERPNPDHSHGGMVNCVRCGASAFGPKWDARTDSHAELVKALEAAEAAYQALVGRSGYQTYQELEDTATKLRQEALATLTARKVG